MIKGCFFYSKVDWMGNDELSNWKSSYQANFAKIYCNLSQHLTRWWNFSWHPLCLLLWSNLNMQEDSCGFFEQCISLKIWKHRTNQIGNYQCKKMTTMAESLIPIITHILERVYFQFRKKRAINFFQMACRITFAWMFLWFGFLPEGECMHCLPEYIKLLEHYVGLK